MCIIVAKPKNAKMPDRFTLENCFDFNSDGCGYMYPKNGEVVIRKGFMDFDDFYDDITFEIKNLKSTPIIMHFRIATHGKVSTGCCHPFPLTDDFKKMRMPECTTDIGVAHNGVIKGRDTSDIKSDTMDFIAGVMVPLHDAMPDFMSNGRILDMLKSACGSKLAIMNGDGNISIVGDFVEDHGVFYSNESYLWHVSKWSSYGSLWNTGDTLFDYANDNGPRFESIADLPWAGCVGCPNAEYCVWEPECNSEIESGEVSALLIDEYEGTTLDYEGVEIPFE